MDPQDNNAGSGDPSKSQRLTRSRISGGLIRMRVTSDAEKTDHRIRVPGGANLAIVAL